MSNQCKCDTYSVQIFLGLREGYNGYAHPFDEVLDYLSSYCDNHSEGLCVTATPTNFVYTGGREQGVIIGLINYPRFPSTPHEITEEACKLATGLHTRFGQYRVTIMGPDQTVMIGNED